MRREITSDTCMLVGSAPGFPHGIIDPIQEIAQLGVRYKIPVHVDACLGGFLIAFMKDAGFPLSPFDFSVPGVTSISCDTHKYGSAPKGTSVVLYRKFDYLKHQLFCQPDWPGGIYATPTMAGSRCGANIAVCWTSLLYFGRQGYVNATRNIITTARYITNELKKIEGIILIGQPEVSVIAFHCKVYSIYTLVDRMTERGWHMNLLQFPPAVHFCLTGRHTRDGVAQRMIKDVQEIVQELLADPEASKIPGKAAVYGSTQKIPDRSLVNEISHMYMEAYYSTDDDINQEKNDLTEETNHMKKRT